MNMFEVQRMPENTTMRKAGTFRKLERMKKAITHQEADRVPISDFFWGSFIARWRHELNLPADANPYYYYDLDWIVTVPNLDPLVRPFETIKENDEGVTVKTGFGAIMRKLFQFPMPEFIGWETDTIEKLEALIFDNAFDPRRYFEPGDNQIAGVGDGFSRNSPAWVKTVEWLWPDFPVFGSVIECSECLTRLIGPENHMLWIGLEPERMAVVLARIGQFYLDCVKAQISAAKGKLDGIVIWGDIAYKSGTFMHPDYWRTNYKPWVKAIADYAHSKGLMVIYHGCGNVNAVFEDFIQAGIDAYNPLEVKAGMDAVELGRRYGHKIAFCGNNNVQLWETGDKEAIKREILYKLNAAKGGGFIFHSDHSVSSNVSGHTYDYIVKLVRQYGRYPLDLEESNEETSKLS
jgi:hypothetical protein